MTTTAPFFSVEPASVQAAMLAMIRLSGMLLLAPPFGMPLVPARLKIAIAFSLMLCVWPTLAVRPPALASDVVGLAALATTEALVGLTIGFIGRLTLSAASVAAELVSIQMGFGLASLLDPLQGAQVTVLTRLYDWTVLTLFLALDAHHLVLGAIVESFRAIPLGGASFMAGGAAAVLPLGGRIFALALSLVAPLLGVLFIANLVMALAARAVPQFNLLTAGLPVVIALGLVLLLANLDPMSAVLGREMRSLEAVWITVLRGFSDGR
jgi:flagellar biosynthetic protein FliR